MGFWSWDYVICGKELYYVWKIVFNVILGFGRDNRDYGDYELLSD